MAKIAFLFPGQGSQQVGMGKDLYETNALAQEVFDHAEDILQFPLKKICFEGPEDTLRQTWFTQPAIFVHSIAVDSILKKRGLAPQGAAGHSLGEYSALVSAGALKFEDGLRLVKIRSELMQSSGEKNPGAMAAIIGLNRSDIDAVCKKASRAGIVQPANFNCPAQVVISGAIPAVRLAMEAAKEKGARLVKELVVGGAFHSPLMGDALNGLSEALKSVEIKAADLPVYSNVEAQPVTEPEKIRDLLQKQLLSPVLWENIMHNMIHDGFDEYYEVGPGKVLQGLLKRTNRDYQCRPMGKADELS